MEQGVPVPRKDVLDELGLTVDQARAILEQPVKRTAAEVAAMKTRIKTIRPSRNETRAWLQVLIAAIAMGTMDWMAGDISDEKFLTVMESPRGGEE